MQRKMLVLVLLTFLMAPLSVLADKGTLGVPDIDCQEDDAARQIHDYGAPATGYLASLPMDGNLDPCPGVISTWFAPSSNECWAFASSPAAYRALCVDDRPADWDGDMEYALGGAYLVSASGDGVTSGGIACYDALGHHPQGGTVYVNDLVFANVFFTVTADFTDPSDPPDPTGGPDCGDNVIQPCDPTPPEPSTLEQPVGGVVDIVNARLWSLTNSDGITCTAGDVAKPCLNSCLLDFAPGTDGAYVVFVGPSLDRNGGESTGATQGHISTGVHPDIPPIVGGLPQVTQCFDGVDNDWDGFADGADPGCSDPTDGEA